MIVQLSVMERELVRKLVHLLILGVLPVLAYSPWIALLSLSFGSIIYILSEQYRIERISRCHHGTCFTPIHRVTVLLAREQERSDIVWAPISLAVGAMITIALFPQPLSHIGILALALGDTAALIGGKVLKGPLLPFTREKHLSGFVSCWIVCAAVVWVYTGHFWAALTAGAAAAAAESLQVRNGDNILLPLAVALVTDFWVCF